MAATVVFPGEPIPRSLLPSHVSKPLKLGPGLRHHDAHSPNSPIVPTTYGTLRTDFRKNAAWVRSPTGRYIPQFHDLVIATIHHNITDYFVCQITPFSPFALLPQLSFEGVSRKTRPMLQEGDVVYARVSLALPYAELELECVSSTGKSEGLGELKGGFVVDVKKEMARKLGLSEKRQREEGIVLLEEIAGRGMVFEIAVGANGKVWVDAGGRIGDTLEICRLIVEMDEESWDEEQQKKAVRKMKFGFD